MNTEAEIKLCRRLQEILKAKGELPEIREGDWVEDVDAIEERILVRGVDDTDYYNSFRKDFILLWSWERAREWLRERGWRLTGHVDYPKEIMCSFSNTLKDELGRGQTDVECALAVMVQVAEEESHESD